MKKEKKKIKIIGSAVFNLTKQWALTSVNKLFNRKPSDAALYSVAIKAQNTSNCQFCSLIIDFMIYYFMIRMRTILKK